jgi:ABC-2 type transport system permease protein
VSAVQASAPRKEHRRSLAHQLRVLRVIATIEYKMKYADSAMGYVWSVAKPLSYFGVLYLIFGHFLKTGGAISRFPYYMLIGLVLYLFFSDAIGLVLPSIVTRGPILRRLAFPTLVIPVSVSMTAGITFAVNVVAVAVFLAIGKIAPGFDWLLIPPLLLELYVFVLGIGLIVCTVFVRLRDVAQLWDLSTQLLIFASPIMYPMSALPSWAQKVEYANPLVQVMQDIRWVVLGRLEPEIDIASVYGSAGRLLPIGVALATFLLGYRMFSREARFFPEQV